MKLLRGADFNIQGIPLVELLYSVLPVCQWWLRWAIYVFFVVFRVRLQSAMYLLPLMLIFEYKK